MKTLWKQSNSSRGLFGLQPNNQDTCYVCWASVCVVVLHGLCFLAVPRSEMIGEHGRQKRRHADVYCDDGGQVAPFARFRFGPNTPCCKQHGESKRTEHELRDRPRVRVTANGIRSALREFDSFCNFFIVVLVQYQRTPRKSSAPCQTLTTQTLRSWKAVAKANGEHSKRTHLGATSFEHVYVMFCVLFSTLPDNPGKRRTVELDPWKAPGPPGLSPFEQAFALNFGDE